MATVLPVRDHERGSVDQVRAAQDWAAAREKPNEDAHRGERGVGDNQRIRAEARRGAASKGSGGLRPR